MRKMKAFNSKQDCFYAIKTIDVDTDLGLSFDYDTNLLDVFMKKKDAMQFARDMNGSFKEDKPKIGTPMRAVVVKICIYPYLTDGEEGG